MVKSFKYFLRCTGKQSPENGEEQISELHGYTSTAEKMFNMKLDYYDLPIAIGIKDVITYY
jgi:hypothetical protein